MPDHADEDIPIGTRIQDLLEALQPARTQAWLADEAGIATSQLSRYLSGKRTPTDEALRCLAPMLGVTPEQLVAGTDAADRLDAASRLVPKAQLDGLREELAAARLLAAAAGQRADQEASVRAELQTELSRAQLAIANLTGDTERLTMSLRISGGQLKRTQAALGRAVSRMNSLQSDNQSLHRLLDQKLTDTEKSSKLGTWLAGIAAGAGVITVAHLMGNGERMEEEEDDA